MIWWERTRAINPYSSVFMVQNKGFTIKQGLWQTNLRPTKAWITHSHSWIYTDPSISIMSQAACHLQSMHVKARARAFVSQHAAQTSMWRAVRVGSSLLETEMVIMNISRAKTWQPKHPKQNKGHMPSQIEIMPCHPNSNVLQAQKPMLPAPWLQLIWIYDWLLHTCL